jgi:predicted anti-sigma-YlaC factor YlaD
MRCNDVTDLLLGLDHGESIPRRVTAHLKTCPECRRRAEALAAAEHSLLLTASGADASLIRSVMRAIEHTESYPIRKHSMLSWLFGGFLLAAALVAVQYSVPFQFLAETVLGPRVELSVTVVIGIVLVAYLAVFVVVNNARLEEFLRHVPGATPHD